MIRHIVALRFRVGTKAYTKAPLYRDLAALPDPVTRAEARAMVASWRIALPPNVAQWLAGDHGQAPNPGDPVFARHEVKVIASAGLSLEAAARAAEAQGVPAVILSDAIEGEARDVGRVHAAIAREIALRNRPFTRPVVLLSGGETTVTLRAKGKGGRNTEFLLATAMAAEGLPFAALAADTDGIDGSEDNAGAFATGTTATHLRALGLDPAAFLAGNDAYSAFTALGDLFVPGPTGTNVNDFRAILLRRRQGRIIRVVVPCCTISSRWLRASTAKTTIPRPSRAGRSDPTVKIACTSSPANTGERNRMFQPRDATASSRTGDWFFSPSISDRTRSPCATRAGNPSSRAAASSMCRAKRSPDRSAKWSIASGVTRAVSVSIRSPICSTLWPCSPGGSIRPVMPAPEHPRATDPWISGPPRTPPGSAG